MDEPDEGQDAASDGEEEQGIPRTREDRLLME